MPRPPRDRPWVSVNFAITWDGRIATRAHGPVTFSSKRDKQRLVEIRSLANAVMVSATTAATDRMTMGIPDEFLRAQRAERGQSPYPLRVLLSNSGRIPLDLPLFTKDFSPIVIFSTQQMPSETQDALRSQATLHLAESTSVDLAETLRTLRHEHAIRHLHCEGGGQILHALLAQSLVDEIYLTVCPRIFGGAETTTLTGKPADFLPQSTQVVLRDFEVIEGEAYLRYTVPRRRAVLS